MISIIIPVYNEADQIAQTIQAVQKNSGPYHPEIIVVDGGSTDDTRQQATTAGAFFLQSPRKGRAAQMNFGAEAAGEEILYFLHADSWPPLHFIDQILRAKEQGAVSGCFRLKFDQDHWFLKANAWFTRFDVNAVRFGDQSLFTTKKAFKAAGGFREDLILMEDQEIIHRLKQQGPFRVLPGYVTTSARKYRDNGVYRMQGIFYRIWAMYYLGYSQEDLARAYKKRILKHKL